MRILLGLSVVMVFAAMWVFDTAALARLTVFCVSGGCGVRPLWIAIGAGGVVLAAVLAMRRPHAGAKLPAVRKPRASGSSRGKSAGPGKPKRAK